MTGVNIFSTSYEVTDELRSTQKIFAEEIAHWSQAFDPLFQSTHKASNTNYGSFITTSSLRIQSVSASILIAGVLFTEETMYDKFKPQFRELLDLLDIIVASRHQQEEYSFWSGGFLIDLGIVPCLFLLVNRCRDFAMRRHAIDVLKGWQMEGVWDPRLIAQIGLFMMEVEEEGAVGGEIPERARAVFSRISQDYEKGVALLQCVLKQGGPRGGKVWREKLVSW